MVRILERSATVTRHIGLIERVASKNIIHGVRHRLDIFAVAGEIMRQPKENTAVHQVRVRTPWILHCRIRNQIPLSLYALRVGIRSINNRLFGFFNVFSRKIVRNQRQGNSPGSRDVLPEEIARSVFIAFRAG